MTIIFRRKGSESCSVAIEVEIHHDECWTLLPILHGALVAALPGDGGIVAEDSWGAIPVRSEYQHCTSCLGGTDTYLVISVNLCEKEHGCK